MLVAAKVFGVAIAESTFKTTVNEVSLGLTKPTTTQR